MKRSLRRFLRRRGVSDAEIENAAQHAYLSVLVLDREIFPGERTLTMPQLAAAANTDLATARTVWRAMGFPDLPDDLRVFTRSDVEALRVFTRRVETGSLFGGWNLERALAQARVLSSGLARVADAETDDLANAVELARASGLDDEATAVALAEHLNFREIAELVDHVHRIQLRAAIWRRLAGVEPSTPGAQSGAVGFVDLVGYTALTMALDTDDLGALIARFADLAHDTVAAAGGRVVKTIGDEVMFVTDTASAAATIAVQLTERSTGDEVLPDTRAGVAFGPLLSREGDYFGPVVNLASRLTEMARPGSVLASAEVASALDGANAITAKRIGSRRIRDIGRVDVFRLRRS